MYILREVGQSTKVRDSFVAKLHRHCKEQPMGTNEMVESKLQSDSILFYKQAPQIPKGSFVPQ